MGICEIRLNHNLENPKNYIMKKEQNENSVDYLKLFVVECRYDLLPQVNIGVEQTLTRLVPLRDVQLFHNKVVDRTFDERKVFQRCDVFEAVFNRNFHLVDRVRKPLATVSCQKFHVKRFEVDVTVLKVQQVAGHFVNHEPVVFQQVHDRAGQFEFG